MTDERRFAGRVALVTGASRGIGAATAKALAAGGAHVILTARDDAALERVEDAIHQAGGTATIAPVDLTESDGVARLAQAIASRWDALDFLVIGAAYLPMLTPVTQIDPKQFSTAITTNVMATQALIAGLHPLLKRADAARVVGLTSSVGETPRAYWAAYGSTKAAFDNLLQCYAQEVANTGAIRVAIVDPGATRTAMREKAYPGEDPQTVKPPEDVAARIADLLAEDFESGHRIRVG
ncbi:MAG: SDR family NAD(P)-dependent oxidoreductase [Erythrobacter sp.]|nr:SDR family NAD(P)-dependent oxidoreductase [Erythrobacter sp.]NCQ63853.1 SDR family NAD(P)-dependent oxidoreductase [Alphaproteobacteria bacterium]